MGGNYDVLIVGAGFFGSTCAYELAKCGFRCLVIERRNHIAGNCYTETKDNINIHRYGPHIFHTSDRAIWEWINQFASFNRYRHHVKVTFNGRIYSFPINLSTFNELWGIRTPAEAMKHLMRIRVPDTDQANVEGWVVGQVGQELYEIFVKGYTEKHWNRKATELPASIVKRIPIRLTYDDNYFDDAYQGIPIGGYTPIFEKLLHGIEVRLNTDYFAGRTDFDGSARAVIYTGPVDRFFGYKFGRLEYRSIHFEDCLHELSDYQGLAQMNYTSHDVEYTRIVEHKHFEFGQQPVTWITKEYPAACTGIGEEMYPVRDTRNLTILKRYQALLGESACEKYYLGGRLAEYRYYDMHQAIGAARQLVAKIERDLRLSDCAHFRTRAAVPA